MNNKLLIVFGIIVIAYVTTCLYFGDFVVGYKDGHAILWNQNAQSSKTDVISEREAISQVNNLPSVLAWRKLFSGPNGVSPITGGKPVVVVNSETDSKYVIHVYEDVYDHTVTFGWYEVDKKTGGVKTILGDM